MHGCHLPVDACLTHGAGRVAAAVERRVGRRPGRLRRGAVEPGGAQAQQQEQGRRLLHRLSLSKTLPA